MSAERMQDKGYNGWANYETWAVGLYLDGNYTGEGTYRSVLESVAAMRRDESDETVRVTVADYLKELTSAHAEAHLTDEASLASDLLGAALSEVDWFELADAKLGEVDES